MDYEQSSDNKSADFQAGQVLGFNVVNHNTQILQMQIKGLMNESIHRAKE